MSHELTVYLSDVYLFFDSVKWSYYQKHLNQITLNDTKLSFTNIRGAWSNFVGYECFLESNSLDILVLCETNLDVSIDSRKFSIRDYLPCSLCEGGTPFSTGRISKELSGFLFVFSTGFTSLFYFFLLYRSLSSLYAVFNTISSK